MFAWTELWFRQDHARALASIKHAVMLNPNNAHFREILANVLCFSGRSEDSLREIELASRLNPHLPPTGLHVAGRILLTLGRYEEAVSYLQKTIDRMPDNTNAWTMLAACYAALDRREDASAAVENILHIHPAYTLQSVSRAAPYKGGDDLNTYVALLRKAGIPERPSN